MTPIENEEALIYIEWGAVDEDIFDSPTNYQMLEKIDIDELEVEERHTKRMQKLKEK